MFGHPVYLHASICFGAPLHVWMHPLYVWMPTCLDVWTLPVCLDNVWMPPYIHNTKKACFVTLRGVSISPHTFGCHLYVWMPLMFGHPPYVWKPHMCSCHLEFLPFWFFLILNILSIFQNIPLCWMPPYV